MLSFDWWLLQIAFLTALLEMPIFYLCGYKRALELLCFGGANLLSNLLLNETLGAYQGWSYWIALVIGELLVVALEFALMIYIIPDKRKRLLQVIGFTNAVSLSIGLIMMLFN